MNTLTIEIQPARATTVRLSDDELIVELEDGRTLAVPIAWYPRLLHGTHDERQNWRLIGTGQGIHWPDLDEDISIEQLLLGILSGESQSSLERWIKARQDLAQL